MTYLEHYKGLPSLAWRGINISLIESFVIGLCYFLSIYFVNELHMDIMHAGMMMAFYGVGTMVGSVVSGKAADYLQPSLVSVLNLLLQSAAFATLTQAHAVAMLALNLFIIGVASYGFITASHLWVLSYCQVGENQRLKAINILSTASNLGLGISSIVIGLFNTKSFTYLFFTASILLFSCAIYILCREKFYNQLTISNVNHDKDEKNYYSMLNANIVFALVCLFFSGIIISQTNSMYSIYLQSIFPAMGAKSFSILFALNTFIVVLFQTPIGNLFAKQNKVITMGISIFLLGFGMVLLNFSYLFAVAILACVLMTLGEIIFFSISFLICYENSEQHKKGAAVGMYRMVYAASRVVGPFLGGMVYGYFGGHVLWYICGVIGVVGVVASVIIFLFQIPHHQQICCWRLHK